MDSQMGGSLQEQEEGGAPLAHWCAIADLKICIIIIIIIISDDKLTRLAAAKFWLILAVVPSCCSQCWLVFFNIRHKHIQFDRQVVNRNQELVKNSKYIDQPSQGKKIIPTCRQYWEPTSGPSESALFSASDGIANILRAPVLSKID